MVRAGAENNRLAGNTVIDADVFDLVDENVDCDNNEWSRNQFGTRNQDCID